MTRYGEQPSTKAYFERYAALGPERSLEKLAHILYLEQNNTTPKETTWLGKLKKWSADYGWQERVIERKLLSFFI